MCGKYETEPAMADWLRDWINKYHYDMQIDNIEELYKLIEKYGMYVCTDKQIDEFKVSNQDKEILIELLIKTLLQFASKPTVYEDEYKYMKKYWYPNWEICGGCSKRYTSRCNKENCNPMDI